MTSRSKDFSSLRLKGPIAAPFTPFLENGDINYDVLGEYVDKLLASGVTSVFVNGTTGEGVSMTMDERKSVAEKWVALGKNRFQAVIIHVGALSLKDMKDLARHAEKIGADAISTLPPLFYKPATTDEMIGFLKEVASAAPNTPFFYYHNPEMTKTSNSAMTIEGILQAAGNKVPNFVGAKFSEMDLYDFGRCLVIGEGRYQIINGKEEQLLPALSLGGEAFIGSTYNYEARVANRLYDALQAGDMATARKEQFRIHALVSVLKKYGSHTGINKAIMSIVGPEMGPSRPPLRTPSQEERALIRKDLEAIDFFDWIQ